MGILWFATSEDAQERLGPKRKNDFAGFPFCRSIVQWIRRTPWFLPRCAFYEVCSLEQAREWLILPEARGKNWGTCLHRSINENFIHHSEVNEWMDSTLSLGMALLSFCTSASVSLTSKDLRFSSKYSSLFVPVKLQSSAISWILSVTRASKVVLISPCTAHHNGQAKLLSSRGTHTTVLVSIEGYPPSRQSLSCNSPVPPTHNVWRKRCNPCRPCAAVGPS